MSTPKLARKTGKSTLQKGQASVEALLVLMILCLVIFGGIELSRGVAIRQALDSSTAAAVRALSLDPSQWSYAQGLVQKDCNQNVMGAEVTTTMIVYDASGTLRSTAWLSGSPFGTPAEHPRSALGHCGAISMKHNKLRSIGIFQDNKAQTAVWGLLTVLVLLILAAGLVDIYRLYAARNWAYSVAQEAALASVSKARQWDDFLGSDSITLDEDVALITAQSIVQSAMQVRGITDYQMDIRVLPDLSGGSIPDFPPHSVRLGEGLGNWSTDEPAVGVYLEVPVQWTLLDLFNIPEKGVRVFAAAGVAQ